LALVEVRQVRRDFSLQDARLMQLGKKADYLVLGGRVVSQPFTGYLPYVVHGHISVKETDD